MRILFLLPDFPYPPTTGGRSKVFNELLYLSKKHQCDLLCIGNPKEVDKEGLARTLPDVRLLNVIPGPTFPLKMMKVFANLLRLLPPSLAAFNEKNFLREIIRSISTEHYDVIHYDIINMAQYVPLGEGIASVHSANDATSLVYSNIANKLPWSIDKLKYLLSAYLFKKYENKIYPSFTKVHVVTELDAKYLQATNCEIDITVIPISLEINNLKQDEGESRTNSNISKNNDILIICTGNLENIAISEGVESFVSDVFPLVMHRIKNVKLIILGANANDNILKSIKDYENIEYISWVEDYNSLLSQADVVLVPDQSGPPGAKTRVLQAMSLGLPVMGTLTAFSGIPITHGENGIIYNSPLECVSLMTALLLDNDIRLKLGLHGYKLAKNTFSINTVGPEYEKMYMNAISKYNEMTISGVT